MPAVVSTDLFGAWQHGQITRAQYDAARKRGLKTFFVTSEGKLVLITPEATVVALARSGKVWTEYQYSGNHKRITFR